MAFKPHIRDARASTFRQYEAYLADSNVGHLARFIYGATMFEDVEGYSALRDEDLTGYEDHPSAFYWSNSPEQTAFIKHGIDKSRDNRRTIHNTDSFGLSLLSGIADPLLLVPIPFLKAVGFAKGAVRGAKGIGGVVAISEGIRQVTDPLSAIEEVVPVIAGGAVLGGLFGGLLGRAGARAARAQDDLWTGIQRAHDEVAEGTFEPASIPDDAGGGPAWRARERSVDIEDELDVWQRDFNKMLEEERRLKVESQRASDDASDAAKRGDDAAADKAFDEHDRLKVERKAIEERINDHVAKKSEATQASEARKAREPREGSDYQFDGPGFLNKMKWAEMPFYRLKAILTEHFPNSPLNKIPEMMVGLPGLITRMNRRGETAGTSATNLARQDAFSLVEAIKEIERGYLRFHGKDGTVASPGRSVLGQRFSNMLNRGDPARMSISEFNQEVGRAMVMGDHAIPEIAETARITRKYFEDWADKLEADGVLFSPLGVKAEISRMTRAIDKKQELIEKLDRPSGMSGKQRSLSVKLSDEINELILRIEFKTRQLEGMAAGDLRPTDFLPIHFKIQRLKSDSEYRESFTKVWEDFYARGGDEAVEGLRTPRQRAEDSVKRVMKEDFDDPLAFDADKARSDPVYKAIMARSAEMRKTLGRTPTHKELGEAMEMPEVEINAAIFKGSQAETITPRELIARKTNIPRELLLDYIETDIDILTRTYGRRMATVHALNKNFRHYSMFEQIEEVKAAFGAKMAEDGADIDALTKAMDNAVTDIEAMRDRMLGTFRMGDADTWTEEIINISKGMANLTLMGGAVQVAMIDTALIATAAGFSRAWRSGLLAMMQNPKQFALSTKEGDFAGLVTERVLHSRIQEITNTAGLHASTGVGRVVQGMQPVVFTLSLFNHFTDLARRVASGIVVSSMGDTIKAIATGTVTKAMERDVAQLARGGIGKAEAIDIWKQIDVHGKKVDDIWAVNTNDWTDDVLVEKFRAALIDTVDNIIIYPGISDTPNFMAKGVFTALLQYRRFGISSSQRIAASAMQFQDARAMAGMTAMVGLAYILESTWRAPRFDNRDFSEKLLDAVETSGVTGIVLDFNSMVENFSGGELGVRPTLGLDPRRKSPNWASQLGAVAGPTGSTLLTLGRAAFDPDVTPGEQAYAVRRSLFLQNLWWGRAGFDSLQRGIESALDPR